MRGNDEKTDQLFSYIRPEARLPERHPLRLIHGIVDDVLGEMSGDFDRIYSGTVPSIDPAEAASARLVVSGVLHDSIQAPAYGTS